jgi:NADH-quinone oxidoreductase subunit G
MACPGGCVGGGGQPYGVTDELRVKRGKGLYKDDEAHTMRYSHENPWVKKVYQDFLGEPLGTKAKELLHAAYKARPEYKK